MVRRRIGFFVLEIVAAVAILVLLAGGWLAWRLAQGPLEVPALQSFAERALTRANGDRPVSLDRLVLAWSEDRSRLELEVRGVEGAPSADGAMTRLEQLNIAFDVWSMLLLRPRIASAGLSGVEVWLTHSGQGCWAGGLGALPPAIAAAEPCPAVDLAKVQGDVASALAELEARDLSGFAVRDLTVRFADHATGVTLSLPDASFDLVRSADRFEIQLNALSVQAEGTAAAAEDRLRLLADLPRDAGSAEVTVDLAQSAVVLAPWLTPHEITLSPAGRVTLRATAGLSIASGLGDVGLEATAAGLDWQALTPALSVETAALGLTYTADEDALAVRELALTTSRGGLSFTGSITGATGLAGLAHAVGRLTVEPAPEPAAPLLTPQPVEVSGTVKLTAADLRPLFARAWPDADVGFTATLPANTARADLQLTAATAGVTGVGPGVVNWAADATSLDALDASLGVSLDLALTGTTQPEAVFAYWPILTDGASLRSWLEQAILSADLDGRAFKLDLPGTVRRQGRIGNENLSLHFGVRNGRFATVPELPPVENGVGEAHLQGQAFGLDVASATWAGVLAEAGRVEVTDFARGVETTSVTARGRGEIGPLLQRLPPAWFAVEGRPTVPLSQLGGTAQGDFRLGLVGSQERADVTFAVTGSYQGLRYPGVFAGLDLTAADGTFRVSPDRLTLAGVGELGGTRTAFDLSQAFREGAATQVAARFDADPAMLNRLGVPVRALVSGPVGVAVEVSLGDRGLNSLIGRLDLARAGVHPPVGAWSKRPGQPGTMEVRMTLTAAGRLEFALSGQAAGATVDANLITTRDGRFERFTATRFVIPELVDAVGEVERRGRDLVARVTAADLDLSEVMTQWFSAAPSAEPASTGGITLRPTPEIEQPRIIARITGRRVVLQRGVELADLSGDAVLRQGALETAALTARSAAGEPLSFEVSELPTGARALALDTNDASLVARAVLGYDGLRGGRVRVAGTLSELGEPLTARLHVRAADVRLSRAPFLAQVLSLASLEGLADTLSGEGVQFSRIEAEVSYAAGRYRFSDAVAAGPAIGITASGAIEPARRSLRIEGVLVPSYGINSFLGELPLIGDLLTSRPGEGIVSLTYGINGTFDRAEVSVNPLSVLTPGILRRIFQSKDATALPAQGPPPAGSR